jgi:competence protein ComEC
MGKIRFYLPLVIVGIVAVIRVYFNCFVSVDNNCLEPKESFFSNKEKFPGKQLAEFRESSIDLVRRYFPSPHSELLIGMVIGADELAKVPKFKDALKNTGTIHVVVVSGFNVSLVASLVMGVLGSKYKIRNLIISQFFTFLYSIMTGFEPPVIRAWIMGSMVSWVKFYGRSVDGFRALVFTAILMVIIWPYFLFSVSFQLSFLATLGLIIFGNTIVDFLGKIFGAGSFFTEDLGTTIAAQIFVLPLVSHYFGRVSVLSFIVNPLILWTVPTATVLGTFYVFTAGISDLIARIFSFLIYPFLDIFVSVINFFSGFEFASVDFGMGVFPLLIYYLFTLLGLYFMSRRKGKKYENK